jgi:hypothetical protein
VGFLPAALPDRKKAAKTKDVHTFFTIRQRSGQKAHSYPARPIH